MIQLAKEYIPESAHQFFLVDVEDYTFPKDLDIIFSFASLLHTDKAHLREILIKGYKSLVSGGIFYISLKYSPYYEELTKEDEFGTRTYYFYNPEEIIEIISDICTDHQIAFQYI